MINKALDKTFMIIRYLTVPPVMIAALLIVLFFCNNTIFNSYIELLISLLFLFLLPVLVYPVTLLIPKLKAKGRKLQRTLAFVFTLVGYIGACIYGFCANCNHELQIIFVTYLVSALLLAFVNKVLHIKASGHACSVVGFVLFLCKDLNLFTLFFSIPIYILAFVASIGTKRHTSKEFILGSLVSCIVFVCLSFWK